MADILNVALDKEASKVTMLLLLLYVYVPNIKLLKLTDMINPKQQPGLQMKCCSLNMLPELTNLVIWAN